MDIQSAKQALESTLNSTAFSTDSLYGILIIVVIAYLIIGGIRRVTNSIGSVIGFMLFLEIAHVCAFSTSLGTMFPSLQELFKYDVFTALAQLCVGTPIADFLLYLGAFLNEVMQTVVDKVLFFMNMFVNYARSQNIAP